MAKDTGKKRRKQKNEEQEELEGWRHGLRPETRQSVFALLAFAGAVFFILSWSGNAGIVGKGVFSVSSYLFGTMFLLLPIALILAGISFLLGIRQKVLGGPLMGGALLLCGVVGFAEIFGGPRTAGLVGYAVAALPLQFLDVVASTLLFAALIAISFLIMFNISIMPRMREKEEEKKEEDIQQPVIEPVPPPVVAPSLPVPLEEKDTQEAFLLSSVPAIRKVAFPYKPPPLTLLEGDRGKPSSGDVRANANIIQRTLQNFGIEVDMGEVNIGPSVTQYTLKPAEGVKLSRITNLASNLGLALAAHPLRIEAPIPGRSLVGIEVPNRAIAFVGLRSVLTEMDAKHGSFTLGFALGRDVTGNAIFADLVRMPHLLVAGSTGSGKSVTIHSLLLGLLFSNPPETLRLLLIDPKRVELTMYNDIPHLITPVITDAKKAIQSLRWAVSEMDRRYHMLEAAKARDIASYNKDAGGENEEKSIMPYLVIVVDELADLMTAYPREVEASIVRLAQMARAVGIHLVVSTQRPSVDVITGLIKANITTRIALQVVSQVDSRTILDMAGAEKLLGRGDMLYLPGDAAKPRRIQGVFVSEEEVRKVTRYLASVGEELVAESEDIFASGNVLSVLEGDGTTDEPMYAEARELVVAAGKASTSLLQRRLGLGYARAARLIDMLEDRGIVGPGNGAKPREILVAGEDANAPRLREEI